MRDPLQDFRTAILATLGHAPDVIEPGRFQRFATSDRRGDDAGWCKLFDDMRGGVFGCYRLGISETWSATDRATMTRGERAELARQVLAATAEREAQQRQQWAENATRNAHLWAECRAAGARRSRHAVSRSGAASVACGRCPSACACIARCPTGTTARRWAPTRRWWRRSSRPMAACWRCTAPTCTRDGRKADVPDRQEADRRGRAAGRCLHPAVRAGARLHRHRRGHRNGAGRVVRIGAADRGRLLRRQPGRAGSGRRACSGS